MHRITLWAALAGLFLCLTPAAHAQPTDAPPDRPPPARNLIHGEVLGAGGLYSLNYERRFAERWTARVGVSAYSGDADAAANESVTLVLVPVMVNVLLPGGAHNLEVGAGPVFGYASATSDEFGELNGVGVGNLSGTIGYRYQPRDGGFSFRAGLLPNFSGASANLWLSLSVGYAF